MRFNSDSMSPLDRWVKGCRHLAKSPRGRALAGWTITETLVASTLMLIVISVAGNGLVQLLRSNYKSNVDSEHRNNVNTTLEFISNEVRRGRMIADSPSKITSTQIPIGGSAVLAFQIPSPTNPSLLISEQIVYYVQDSKDSKNPEASWLGPRVLWRYGPKLDANGNYDTPENISSWQKTPIMGMVMDKNNNAQRLSCDPYNPSARSIPVGWRRLPEKDEDVEGIYACVKNGGSQVILATNVQSNLTTNESANYALSTKIATRSADKPFFLKADFAVGPNRIFLTKPGDVEAKILGSDICKTDCYVSTKASDDRFSRDLKSGANTTVAADAGDEFVIYVEGRSNSYGKDGNNRNQTVNLYTIGQTIPPNLPNVTLAENQILVVINDLTKNPAQTYTVLVTITPRNPAKP
jgi:hypothetical protein